MEQSKLKWIQKSLSFHKKRGCHIITNEVQKEIQKDIKTIKIGVLHLFIKHTSAAITINESYAKEVMGDLANGIDRLVPEDDSLYEHVDEGPDDAPSHIKCSLIGTDLTIPITDGELNLGTWQGIILCEFRNSSKTRTIIATINGTE